MEGLSLNDFRELRRQGYSTDEIKQAIAVEDYAGYSRQLDQSYQGVRTMQSQDPRKLASNSMYAGYDEQNLIKWQLELDSILERLEHMLRGDIVKFEEGHMIWKKPERETDQRLNDYGVQEIMRILTSYLNRNTILSNYSEEIINWKILDFGFELADLIAMKYEKMGLTDLERRKLYPMLVLEIVDIVHSSYLRALNGGERESLREARVVNQSEPLGGITINNSGMPGQRERSILNPLRWMGKKYK